MNTDPSEMAINNQIRYLCDLLHREQPLFDSCCLLLKTLNTFIGAAVSNWYWYDDQNRTFILFASSSPALSNYGENQVRLNDFFTGRVLRNNYEPYQVHIQKTNRYKLFLSQSLQLRGQLAGCILVESISVSQEFDYQLYFLNHLITLLNIELPGLLQINNAFEQTGYSVLNELTYLFDQITNIRHLAKLVVRNACMVFESQHCVLSLYNPTMNCFEVLDTCSKIDKAMLPRILYLDKSIAMRTTMDPGAPLKEHVMIHDYTNEASPPVSVLSICLKNNQSIFGALSLYGKRSHDPLGHQYDFTLADQELFVHFSDLVSAQLDRFLIGGV
ncbi:MAG: hypothetical protein JW915_15235 [Chitinispirillaceae bacterium]|nr:hypothetical protein [Chitinispirillaceae bacterium]